MIRGRHFPKASSVAADARRSRVAVRRSMGPWSPIGGGTALASGSSVGCAPSAADHRARPAQRESESKSPKLIGQRNGGKGMKTRSFPVPIPLPPFLCPKSPCPAPVHLPTSSLRLRPRFPSSGRISEISKTLPPRRLSNLCPRWDKDWSSSRPDFPRGSSRRRRRLSPNQTTTPPRPRSRESQNHPPARCSRHPRHSKPCH